MVQLLASLLFFIVFIMLFIALALYLGKAVYDLLKPMRAKKPAQPPPDIEDEPIKLHISGGLLEVNRLTDDEQEEH